MPRKILKMNVAAFANIDIKKIIDRHVKLVTTPAERIVNYDEITCDDSFVAQIETVRPAKSSPRKAVLLPKYIFLINLIIARCRHFKEEGIRLYYSVMVAVLGKQYSDMLRTLEDLGLITLGQSFEIGKYGRTIMLNNWNITYSVTHNIKVIEYSNKLEKLMSQIKKEQNPESNKKDSFFISYEKALSFLQLTHKDEALEYIENKKFTTEKSKQYYLSKINDFDNVDKKKYTVDENSRIYHFLTNLPRELKPFYNIRYQCDIHNSHPLLFSLFLINIYNIDINIINILLSIDIARYHHLGQLVYKSLNDKGLHVPKNKRIPNDILQYIYAVSKGIFWDNFIEIFDGIDRSELKSSMFCEVFYSNKSKDTRNKKFAKVFKSVFPNVWKAIKSIKSQESEKLPCLMMQKESELFHEILSECFQRGWQVINIHDAVIVLDVQENETFSLDELLSIMTRVYAKKNLYPCISVDCYK